MALKHIVVGWHRSGFNYAARFLSSCQLQVGFTFDSTTTPQNIAQKVARAREIEMSPWLVPFLNHEALRGIPVTFMLRDPMMVYNSLVHYGHFQGPKSTELEDFVNRTINKFKVSFGGRPKQAPVAYLTTWYNVAQNYVKDLRKIQVEYFPYAAIAHFNSERKDVPFICPHADATDYIPGTTLSKLPDRVQKPMRDLLTVTNYYYPNTAPPFGSPHYMRSDWNM
jgi:hypothetical protein